MTEDLALTADENGELVLHRVDCPEVRRLADAGEMVLTMLECQNPPTPEMVGRQHSCLRR